MIGATPSRLSYFKKIRAEMDAELKAVLTPAEAVARGLVPTEQVFAVRLWDNIVKAVEAKVQAGDGAALVSRRDGKDVEVWALPETQPEVAAP